MIDDVVTADDYAFVANLLRERCALVLEPGKKYLIRARLTPVAQRNNLDNVPLLISRIRREQPQALITEVVETMVTTETSFFRDIHRSKRSRKRCCRSWQLAIRRQEPKSPLRWSRTSPANSPT